MSKDVATPDPGDGSTNLDGTSGQGGRPAGLHLRTVRGPDDPALAGRHVVGVTSFADRSGPAEWSGPGLRVEVPLIAIEGSPRHEVWTAEVAPDPVVEGRVSASIVPDSMFGAVELPDGPIADAARASFTDLLGFCARHARPYPVRVWCVLPDIHGIEHGLERYQAFCAGRARAFEEFFGDGYCTRLCASTAVGSHRGPAVVYFLASTSAGEHLENPRQVSAYSYPSCHGPKSPSFARATEAWGRLLVSGTASIVGHESLHVGDARAQTDETLDNIEALRRVANHRSGTATWKVYIRDAEDVGPVLERMRDRVGEDADIVALIADICRRELLVEIETAID